MMEPEWMQFENTGSIIDYLRYKGQVDDVAVSIEEKGKGRSVTENGTYHSADGYGAFSSSGGGIR